MMEVFMVLGLSPYFILLDFFLFSFAGWIYESAFVSIRDRKPVNRGFLVGPVLPLYGLGAVSVYILLRPFSHIPTLLFITGMVLATVIEYITSWLLEICFHAKWWDYSQEPYNFQGRVALIPSLFWGLLSLILFDFLQPLATKIIYAIPHTVGNAILTISILVMALDTIYTIITAINFRKQLEKLYEFRNELDGLLSELPSIRKWFIGTIREWSDKLPSREMLAEKLKSVPKNPSENDSKFSAIEERIKNYWETYTSFLKKRPFTSNKRLLDAFPTMKFFPKNHSPVSVKDFLGNIRKKVSNKKKDTQDF